MNWWSRNAEAIEAMAATVTAFVAIAALVGIKLQLDEADRLQQSQSARDAYRAHLALAATQSEFARPTDACALIASSQGGAYEAFVDHLLYSAEQMLIADDGWDATFLDALTAHSDYICSTSSPQGQTKETILLLSSFRENSCPSEPTC